MKYIKKLIRNSKRALNQQVIKKKQEIVKYAPRLTGIQASNFLQKSSERQFYFYADFDLSDTEVHQFFVF